MPETSAQGTLEQLRTSHQVRLVEGSEEGFGIQHLPNGVYGFTHAPAEASVPLFAKKSWHSFEMHKLPDGTQYLVGFVTAREAGLICEGLAAKVVLFPDPWEDSTELVNVPVSRMAPSKNGPSREGGNGLPLEVV